MTTNSPMHASTSPLADPNTVQKPNPVSWADMNDDDDFDFPVINLAKFRDDDEDDAVAQPTVAAVHEEAAVSAPAATADRSPAAAQRGVPTKVRAPHAVPADAADGTPKRNRIISSEDAVYTVPAKVDGGSHGPRSSEKRTVAREGSSGNHHSPSRALLPAFVQITVESSIPYALRSSAASSQNDLDGVGWSSLLQSQNVLEALAGPEKAARKCRSEVRRTKAVQLLREALVSAPEPIPCDDLAKLVGWNRKFRPAVGCLFSFLKKHRDQFAYSKGAVSLVVAQPAAESAASGQTNVAQVAAAASISPELVRGA